MVWHDGPPGQWTTADGGSTPPWHLVFWLLPVGNPPGSEWGVVGWGSLWYVKTYLMFVVLSPALLWVFRKAPWPTLAAPFVLLVLEEVDALPLSGWWGNSISDVLTYLGCWLVGFAHAEGILKRLTLPAVIGIGGVAAIAGVVWLAGPANSAAEDAGEAAWALTESHLAIGLYYCGLVFILMRFSFQMDWLKRFPLLDRTITVINSRAVTIFLWHGVALLLAENLFGRFGMAKPYLTFPFAWVLIGVAVLAFGWVEDFAARRKPELLPGKPARVATAAGPAGALPHGPAGALPHGPAGALPHGPVGASAEPTPSGQAADRPSASG